MLALDSSSTKYAGQLMLLAQRIMPRPAPTQSISGSLWPIMKTASAVSIS